jgi:NADPH-dependent curcumin reductase CurA
MGIRMRTDIASYAEPYQENEPVGAESLGEVVTSRHPDLEPGDWILNTSRWREFATIPGAPEQIADPEIADDVAWMSVLGMTGITAWIALYEICSLRPGETVAVTAAGGGVGTVAVQLAKAAGARVIAVAGGSTSAAISRRRSASMSRSTTRRGIWRRNLPRWLTESMCSWTMSAVRSLGRSCRS